MCLSVAMCTYNGEKYLREQLDSIAAQTRQPDELVVCDDQSSDNTISILRDFAAHCDFPVRIIVNEVNLGSTLNFDKAINLCEGEIIALCDQDDVWLPEKLELLEAELIANPEVGLVFSNAELVDADLNSLHRQMLRASQMTNAVVEQIRQGRDTAFAVLLRRNLVMGAACAFRADYIKTFSPISPLWVHDYWITLLICTQAKILPLMQSLMLYRQHGANQIGVSTKTWQSTILMAFRARNIPADAYQKDYDKLMAIEARLLENPQDELTETFRNLLRKKLELVHFRANLPGNYLSRWVSIIQHIRQTNYQRYAPNGIFSALRDAVAPTNFFQKHK